ncbi:SelT/SelW/SelH family protein [Rossellomorea vietnamensis]|uniref:SelT/SelW/SelH family protein n=1 Tax=Rossellomorea vietnamensis TaxID=218284 RepID=A0A5D4NXL4_9BACI|nr:SelT/SelW/SelH family protein [Rossellomorea vietnamensis]
MFNHFRSSLGEMKLIPSSGGAFEVTVNGEKIYSKLETGIFPDIDDTIREMESK